MSDDNEKIIELEPGSVRHVEGQRVSWRKVIKVSSFLFAVWITSVFFLNSVGLVYAESDAAWLWLLGGPALIAWVGFVIFD
jgi:uncharacterized membrane protein (Fun14 family)